jgi:hypothetical protein
MGNMICSKLIFKINEEIQTFQGKHKLKQFMITEPQDKEILQTDEK